MTARAPIEVQAQPGSQVLVKNAVTGDIAGYVDVPHVPSLEHDDWQAVLPRTAEILKRNGVQLEPCAHCTICERPKT